jgi:phage gp29-like protein
MNLLDLLFRRRPTATRRALRSHLHEPPAIAQTMDAGRISDILRSAESGDMSDFFSLARDITSGHGHTLTEFGKRKLAVLAQTQSFPPDDPDAPDQVALAREIGRHLEGIPSWFNSMVHLLDSTLLPVAVLQKVYRPSRKPGWRFELADLIPVPYHLLDFTTGTLRIREVGEDGAFTGISYAPDPIRYVIHRGHLLTSCPDTWGGPMRAVLFWWLFATQDRDWWSRFLERFGAPFLEGTYNKEDDTSRMLLERAFSAATRLFGIAVPDDASVKIHQANTSQGGDAFKQFHSVANSEISKIIVGQDGAEGKAMGISGDGQSAAQENVRGDIRQFDAIMLAFTVRTQIIAPLCEINGWATEPPRIAWGGDDIDDLATLSATLEKLRLSGVVVTDEAIDLLSKRVALPLMREVKAPVPTLGQFTALASPSIGRTLAATSAGAQAAVDRLAADSADPFAAAMASTLEPLAALVSESTSLADLEARLLRAIPTLDHRRAAQIAEGVLVASSANAAAGFRDS